MGHSFGGATILANALQQQQQSSSPQLKLKLNLPPSSFKYKGIVAHDPAFNWIPDQQRLALFNIKRVVDTTVKTAKYACAAYIA